MKAKPKTNSTRGRIAILLGLFALGLSGPAAAQQVVPTFSKAFEPSTIGIGSVSTLRFTIVNTNQVDPLSDLAFTDTLPAGVTIAAPAAVTTTCGGIVTAPEGGTTINFSDGVLGVASNCAITVNLTSSTLGTHTNTTGDLTSNAGNSGTATDDLEVDIGRPGFTKAFAPGTVAFGGRSTLTFTIDNNDEVAVATLSFTDNLPPGMVIANPANASTDCFTPPLTATLTAVPGTGVISLSSAGIGGFPALPAGSTCTVVVDVIGGAAGSLGNTSGELLATIGVTQVSSGKAAAVLEVTGLTDPLTLIKEFTNDPVAPGGTVNLQFTVTNRDRVEPATGIGFDDDLEATLTGLAPGGPLPAAPCGAGSALSFGSGVLSLSGGNLGAGASCTFSVVLDVPTGSVAGAYPNTAGPVSGDIGGGMVTGNTAGDLLFVVSYPVLTKVFTDDPVAAGGTATLEFTITNSNASSALDNIAFQDELTTFLPLPLSVGLPPTPDPPCGAGSSLSLGPMGLFLEGQGLILQNGSLAAAGSLGDSCTFSVTVDIPASVLSGTYPNITSEITAELTDLGNQPVTGPPAVDNLVVVGAPSLRKEFTDDPVPPGGTVTLEFTLTHDALAATDATGVGFTDDLATTLPGLTGTGLPLADLCGPTNGTLSGSAGDTFLTVAGIALAPGDTCTFSVTLQVPAGAPSGPFGNTTSDLSATVDGLTVTGNPATDDLLVTGLLFSKEFTDDPAIR